MQELRPTASDGRGQKKTSITSEATGRLTTSGSPLSALKLKFILDVNLDISKVHLISFSSCAFHIKAALAIWYYKQ